MNKYLLEIGTEELAYKFIPSAMEQLKNLFSEYLMDNKITYDDIKVYATPRRLSVLIENIATKQEDIQKIIKGPIANIAYNDDGSLSKAAIGFANKNSITPDVLFKQDNYIWAKIEQKGQSTKEILSKIVPAIILKLKGTHFMRWADFDIKFQRPIRWLVSLFNSEIVDFEITGVHASNISRGHRFSANEIIINNPDEYLQKLENAKVIADVEKRKNTIVNLAKQKAQELSASIVIDDALLDEITFITEWPIPVICSFDEKYLQIPEKVTVTVMAVHQRYFPLYKDGKLLNKFITISNYIGDVFDNIQAGNERVVTARLEDAVFFVQEDTQKPLSLYVEDLKGVTFQKGLGSVYDKTLRIIELSKYIANELGIKSDTIERTALLCKADLVTKLVFEFTELQGYIGCDYALRSGELTDVAIGIKEHYFPLSADSSLANGIEGQIVGIADKIDTIVAIFADGKKVSGSQDPLGVRRCALGILKTILQKNLNINLSQLIKHAIQNIPLKIDDKDKLYNSIYEFLVNRLTILLSDNYKRDIFDSCVSNKDVLSDLKDFILRLNLVTQILQNPDYGNFHESVNRIIRILKNEKDFNAVDNSLFVQEQESILYNSIKDIDEKNLDYYELSNKLFEILPNIKEYFDKVLVMDTDEQIKKNKLNLLNLVKAKFDIIADFSKIVY